MNCVRPASSNHHLISEPVVAGKSDWLRNPLPCQPKRYTRNILSSKEITPAFKQRLFYFVAFLFLTLFFSICFPTRQAVKKTHQRSRSDATVAVKLSHRRTPSTGSAKNSLGDLNSGRAFDNGCICFDANGPEFARKLACTCHAPRLLPQFEFIKGILSIQQYSLLMNNRKRAY